MGQKKLSELEVGTLKGLEEMHLYLFERLKSYDAGKIREVNISKGNF